MIEQLSQEKLEKQERLAEFSAAMLIKTVEFQLIKEIGRDIWDKIEENGKQDLLWYYCVKKYSTDPKGLETSFLAVHLSFGCKIADEDIDEILTTYGYIPGHQEPIPTELDTVKIRTRNILIALSHIIFYQVDREFGRDVLQKWHKDQLGNLLHARFIDRFEMTPEQLEKNIFQTALKIRYDKDWRKFKDTLTPLMDLYSSKEGN